MRNGDILILKGHEVARLLAGQEDELLCVVRSACEARGPRGGIETEEIN